MIKKSHYLVLCLFILLSLLLKLIMIFLYNNQLTVSSDDLNYIKSAIVLLKEGIFTYQNFNEPTVFVMPIYPFFLAAIFKLFGYGLMGLQAVRVVQAILSCITIILVLLTANKLFNYKIALVASFFTAFYIPNITTVGYLLTETLFTMLFMTLIFFSLSFADKPSKVKFAFLGVIWAIVTLCRPTIALYPIFLASYYLIHCKMKLYQITKLYGAMILSFIIIISPWWIRNFKEYGEFIPLAASSGNPMLQGTYVNYVQSPETVIYYPLGNNSLETNKIEMQVAKRRIKIEFQKNFWSYMQWYTVKKTILYWCGVFYWQEVFGINKYAALAFHYVLLLGIPGILVLIFNNFSKYMLPVSVIVYFNAIHCIYMAFDRYAFPMMTLMSIFAASFILKVMPPIANLIRHKLVLFNTTKL